MADNKSIAFFLLLLAFLFLLTVPFVVIFLHYSGLLPLPKFITYHNVSIAATAGLFAIPVLLIYVAAIIIALKKGRPAGAVQPAAAVSRAVAVGKQVHYPWEDVFGPEREMVAEEPYSRVQGKQFAGNYRALAVVVVVLAVVALVLISVVLNANNALFGSGHNETKSANITKVASNASAAKASGSLFSRLFSAAKTQVSAQPVIKEAKPQSKSPAGVSVLSAVKGFGSKVKKAFLSSLSSVKLWVSKVNHAVWRNIAIACVIIIFAASLFYSSKSGQLGGVLGWFRDWLAWLAAILAAARKNWLKVSLAIILIAVICAATGAVVFRKWLSARGLHVRLPAAGSISDSVVNALLAIRDFVAVYRLYIIIGVVALLVIIGVLLVFERRGKS